MSDHEEGHDEKGHGGGGHGGGGHGGGGHGGGHEEHEGVPEWMVSFADNTALMMGLFGLIFPGVDNQAHLGGFVGGYLAGLLLDPRKPERIDHLVAGAACLVATLIAIVASVVTALPLLMN